MDNDIELTELIDLDVERQDGVARPASGFTFLVKKSAAPTNEESESVENDPTPEAPEAPVTKTSEAAPEAAPASVEKAEFDALSSRVEKMESALAEATKQRDEAKAAEAAAKSELEVLKATPTPGGPALSAAPADKQIKAKTEAIAKAAAYRRTAANVADREIAAEYLRLAAEQDKLAA